MGEFRIETLQPRYFHALEQLQVESYPTLAAADLMRAHHFAAQYKRFAEGQYVALDGARVIGQGSGFFTEFDFAHPNHRFRDFCGGLTFDRHDPTGPWYYGADISVHPDYRGRGVGRLLYAARKELVRRHNRRGIVAGGALPGYAAHKAHMTALEYVQHVAAGALADPTLSFQRHMGFEAVGVIENYMEDSASDNWASLIVWTNPAYVQAMPLTPEALTQE